MAKGKENVLKEQAVKKIVKPRLYITIEDEEELLEAGVPAIVPVVFTSPPWILIPSLILITSWSALPIALPTALPSHFFQRIS